MDFTKTSIAGAVVTTAGMLVTATTMTMVPVSAQAQTCASLIALGVAVAPTKCVKGADIGFAAINSGRIKDLTIREQDMADNSVSNRMMRDDAIGAAEIQINAVGQSELAPNSILSGNIVDGQVGSADIRDNNVGSVDVTNESLTSADLAPNSVGASEIQPNAVGASELAPNSVFSADIVNGQVTSLDIADNTVSSADVTNNSLLDVDIRDEAGLDFSATGNNTALSNVDTVVRSVNISAPTSGYVQVTASAYFFGPSGFGRCSITNGAAAIDFNQFAAGGVTSATDFQPIALVRTYFVNAGVRTFNMVCDEGAGTITLADPSMSAIFVPTRY